MISEVEKLDNPVWYSLTETHENFAISYNGTKFYHPDYCPFGGFTVIDSTQPACDRYAELINNFFVIGDQPNFSDHLKINKELICNQMILSNPINIPITEEITELEADQNKDLFNLVNLVQPGYFKRQTPQLGNYYGIYKDGQLIAASGERMKMNAYTEISAVVTHPDHTGKGYAKQLIAHNSKNIFNENKTPILHVADNNIGAIKLYEKLGFATRRTISFWNLVDASQ